MNNKEELKRKIEHVMKKIDSEKLYLEYNELENESKALNTFEEIIEFVCKYCIDTKSPTFMSKLYTGGDDISLIADLLISYFNTNVHVYSVSPVFTLAEEQILGEIYKHVNFKNGDGLFLPGGSYCNTIAMICAKYYYDPDYKFNGNKYITKCITSTRSHYSIDKSAIMIGIGLNNVIKLDYSKLSEESLEEIIKENKIFFINSTFGTTSEGIFEDINQYNNLLKKYKIWHHIDACVGGLAIFSDKYRYLTKNFENADSITLDFHKAMNITVQCSCLVVNHKNILKNIASINADYLFHIDSNHDISNRSFQCGRKADGFKLWIYYKLNMLNEKSTNFFDNVERFKRIIENDSRYTAIHRESMTHICFRINDFNNKYLHNVIADLRKKNIFLEYHIDYIRMVPISPYLTEDIIISILDNIYEISNILLVK